MHKKAIFVYETLDNLQSNDCNYKKQMFLFSYKLFTLLFGCVIIMNKPTHINPKVNRINCIPSSNNTPTVSITEPTYKSLYKSTNGPTCEATHVPITAKSVLTIINICNILRSINNNSINNICNTLFGVNSVPNPLMYHQTYWFRNKERVVKYNIVIIITIGVL